MALSGAKNRRTFAELCARLERHGFLISHLSQEPEGEGGLYLKLTVISRQSNLYLKVEGKIGPPYWGEDLFYRMVSQVENFGVS